MNSRPLTVLSLPPLIVLLLIFSLSSCRPEKQANAPHQPDPLSTNTSAPAHPNLSLIALDPEFFRTFVLGTRSPRADEVSDPFGSSSEEEEEVFDKASALFQKKHRIPDPLLPELTQLSSDSDTSVIDLKPSLTAAGLIFQKEDHAILYYNSYQEFLLLKSTPENITTLESLLRASGYIKRPKSYLTTLIIKEATTENTLSSLAISGRSSQAVIIKQQDRQLEIELTTSTSESLVDVRVLYQDTPENPAHHQKIATTVTYSLGELQFIAGHQNPRTKKLENFYLQTEVQEALHPYETPEFREKIAHVLLNK